MKQPTRATVSTCWQVTIAGMPITLEQRGVDDFRVTYWKQVDSGLTYSQAAQKLGENIMHAVACAGKLDNGCDQ